MCLDFLRPTPSISPARLTFMKRSSEALLSRFRRECEFGSTAPSLSLAGDHVSNSPQVLIGVVADGQNQNQACFRSTQRDIDQSRPFDRMPQQSLASRDHRIENNSVILAPLRPMHGADQDLGLSSISEKSFD